MPIIASVSAASTDGMPKSAHSEMKCVWMSPLVLSPQMKKVPASTQNVGLRQTIAQRRRRPEPSPGAGGGWPAPPTGASPNGASPTSDGRSRMNSRIRTATTPQRTDGRQQRIAPAHMIDEPRGERQEHELAGGRARRQHADDEAAARRRTSASRRWRRAPAPSCRCRCRPRRPTARRGATTASSSAPATGPDMMKPIAAMTTRRTP